MAPTGASVGEIGRTHLNPRGFVNVAANSPLAAALMPGWYALCPTDTLGGQSAITWCPVTAGSVPQVICDRNAIVGIDPGTFFPFPADGS